MGLLKKKRVAKDCASESQGEINEVKARLDRVEGRLRLLEQTVKVYKRET